MLAFASFSILASSTYIFNDIIDRKRDRKHPTKKYRPIAAGNISINSAIILCIFLLGSGIILASIINTAFIVISLSYVLLNLLYSIIFKHKVIVDVMCISIGFVLRAVAGALAIDVWPSSWLIICTLSLTMTLGFGKRRCEIGLLGNSNQGYRPVNYIYTPEKLNHFLSVTSAITIVTFLLYCVSPEVISRLGNNYLVYTSPLPIYALFRFVSKCEESKASDPVEILTSDIIFPLTCLTWLIIVILIIYYV